MDRIQELIAQLKHFDPDRRREAILELSNLGPAAREALPALREVMKDPDWLTASLAAAALYRVNAQSGGRESFKSGYRSAGPPHNGRNGCLVSPTPPRRRWPG